MISPHTPPGTDIIAIVNSPPEDGLPGVRKGTMYSVYFIGRTRPCEPERFAVVLREHGIGRRIIRTRRFLFSVRTDQFDSGYSLSWFRYPELAGLDALPDAEIIAGLEMTETLI